MEAVRDHRPCLQGLYPQRFAKAAFGVITAYRDVAFGHGVAVVRERGR